MYPDPSKYDAYQRFEDTKTGISPRAIPGTEGFIFRTTGLEHTEEGFPDYTPANHMKMTEKRHRKIEGALADLPEPVEFSSRGNLDLGVITWGSTFGAALEAVQRPKGRG